ncbi:PhoX family protein [Tomitella cavernea]|uniref:PhoX family phosphatase n=1 Tax=Tomitella cavernea TaxID=1387982 RepID=A0ABP9C661_9ACTN|nr:PhoX family phosphatase [Tomitella cavernea]
MVERIRRSLPMAGLTRGKRSPVTCQFKCANACTRPVCNDSPNEYFRDIVSAGFSRRSLLGAGAVGAMAVTLAACSASGAATTGSAGSAAGGAGSAGGAAGTGGPLAFSPIAPVDKSVDAFTVPGGYDWRPILRWGDPLFTDSPAFDLHAQSAKAQALQFGYNNDYLEILRTKDGRKALLYCNHEYVNPDLMFPETGGPAETERHGIAKAAHGGSVVELERASASEPWTYVRGGRLNWRITADTEFELTGAAAGSEMMTTADDPSGRRVRGMVGNCAGGTTPWGTILSGEENFDGYFRAEGTSTGEKRYGLNAEETSNGWEKTDRRFDARRPDFRNEPNRFGYIVEIDPNDPTSTPVKHTALGRMKHEGATVALARNGKAVAYMGDDERFDYLYKFVSKRKYRKGDRAHNKKLLTEGDLYVARFQGDSDPAQIDGSGALPSDGRFDGSGMWLPLIKNGKSAAPGMSVEQVLVYTRLAGDKVGATKMDRCEDVEPNPETGRVYVACTNNTKRGTDGEAGADEANPRHENRDGHVVEIEEAGGDATAERFGWNLLLVCGDPADDDATYFGGYPADKVSAISCPDNLAFDRSGNLWISTDGQPGTIGCNDGLFRVALDGDRRGFVEQFLAVPREAETCGPLVHEEEGNVFVAVQHPGEDGSFAEPHSLFPDYVSGTPQPGQAATPRPSVVQVFRTA